MICKGSGFPRPARKCRPSQFQISGSRRGRFRPRRATTRAPNEPLSFMAPNKVHQDPFQPQVTPAGADFRSRTAFGDSVDSFQDHGGRPTEKHHVFVCLWANSLIAQIGGWAGVSCTLRQRPMAGAAGCGCLLYTSPSQRDRTRSRMPSSA